MLLRRWGFPHYFDVSVEITGRPSLTLPFPSWDVDCYGESLNWLVGNRRYTQVRRYFPSDLPTDKYLPMKFLVSMAHSDPVSGPGWDPCRPLIGSLSPNHSDWSLIELDCQVQPSTTLWPLVCRTCIFGCWMWITPVRKRSTRITPSHLYGVSHFLTGTVHLSAPTLNYPWADRSCSTCIQLSCYICQFQLNLSWQVRTRQ